MEWEFWKHHPDAEYRAYLTGNVLLPIDRTWKPGRVTRVRVSKSLGLDAINLWSGHAGDLAVNLLFLTREKVMKVGHLAGFHDDGSYAIWCVKEYSIQTEKTIGDDTEEVNIEDDLLAT